MFVLLTQQVPDKGGLGEAITKLLANPAVMTAIQTALVAFMGYLSMKIKGVKEAQEKNKQDYRDLGESNKRGSLRNEYLSIFNSPNLTNEQKYLMSRDIIRDYEKLNGNHYLHSLDDELFKMYQERPNETK